MRNRPIIVVLAVSLLGAVMLRAGTKTSAGKEAAATIAKEPSIYEKIWGLSTLYKDKDNPVIQDFSLTGILQLQWADGDSNRGSYGSRDLPSAPGIPSSLWGDVDARRWRLGFKSQWFHDFKVTGIIDVNPNWDPFYKDIYDLSILYAPNEVFNLGIGKRKAHFFTQEFNTNVAELLTFEQSLLVNLLIPKELTGVWVTGTAGHWTYALAGWAGDYQTEFSQFDVGAVIQASIGYDFASMLGVDKALVKLDYQASTDAANSSGPKRFDNALSLNTTFQAGRAGFYSDILGGTGRGSQGDVWGVIFTPIYFIVEDTLQIILRYQYAHGDNNGLILQPRYELLAPDIKDTKGLGSDYNALYLGLNYYLYGHRLKLMAGTEYNDMSGAKKDSSGWTTLAGLRLAF